MQDAKGDPCPGVGATDTPKQDPCECGCSYEAHKHADPHLGPCPCCACECEAYTPADEFSPDGALGCLDETQAEILREHDEQARAYEGDPPDVAPDGSKALGCCGCERTFATAGEQDAHEQLTGHDIGYEPYSPERKQASKRPLWQVGLFVDLNWSSNEKVLPTYEQAEEAMNMLGCMHVEAEDEMNGIWLADLDWSSVVAAEILVELSDGVRVHVNVETP